MQIIAHRGNSYAHHENTIRAFEQALADGADGIEFDVRLTRDREWIVHHDAEIAENELHVRIADVPMPELQKLRVGPHRDPLPRLDDFLAWARDKHTSLVFDIKDRDGIPNLVETVDQASLGGTILLTSFHRTVLKELETLRPDWPRGLIVVNPRSHLARRMLVGSILRWAQRHHLTSLHLEEHWVSPTLVTRIRQTGVRMAVWTVDDPLRMTLLSALGIDAVITNRPDLARITLRG